MNPVSPTPGRPTRVRIVEATRPHTPRLHSPPQEADADTGRLQTHNDGTKRQPEPQRRLDNTFKNGILHNQVASFSMHFWLRIR